MSSGATLNDTSSARTRSMPRSAQIVCRMLDNISHGAISLQLPDGSVRRYGSGSPHALIVVENWSVFGASLRGGDIGLAESYIEARWHSPTLPSLLEVALANRDALEQVIYGHWASRTLARLRHVLNRNTRSGARRNIHAHYDLGNAFYSLWLDPGMTYSSALFDGDDSRSLTQAQDAKYDRVLDQLALAPGARLLEVGCGWGGLAERAAARDLDVDGLTLSSEQLEWAGRRVATAGHSERVRLRLQDYRDEWGRYDGIASIEMFEAVGERYWPDYFAALARCLKPGGRALVQTITIDDALFERYRVGSDFIQQYIFPGGMLPSPSLFAAQAERAGLRVVDRYAFGSDYARTLALWRTRFLDCLDAVRGLGFDERFIRTWEFYLAYCEAAFRRGSTDVIQFTLARN